MTADRRALKNVSFFVLLGLAFLSAAFFRFWAAPFSAGPDVAQFWSFAKVFHQYGLDFYQYARAQLDIFPFKAWAYVYPPVWLLILGVCLLFTPLSTATDAMVDTGWRLAMKTPIIFADLSIGALLFTGIPGSRWKKLLFASLWLLHPTAWYNSAVFGQFDAIAAAFLLASLIILDKGKDRLAMIFAGMAIATKQHALIPVVFILVTCLPDMKWRRLIVNCAIIAGVVAAISLPFLLTGHISGYLHSFFLPGQQADYQTPLVYSFNGIAALLTHLHNTMQWDTVGLIKLTTPVLAIALFSVFILALLKRIHPLRAALIGFLLFIAFFYRINYQYLVIYIPLALLIAAKTPHISERIYCLVLALMPAVWLWLFNVSFWFTYLTPVHPRAHTILSRLELANGSLPDTVYVGFALGLMVLCIIYIIGTFIWWRKPPVSVKSSVV